MSNLSDYKLTISTNDDLSLTGSITANNITVSSNLTVQGTTTTVNTATLSVSDNKVILNSDVTGTPSLDATFEIKRGTSTNTSIRWNETTDKWQQTRDGSIYVDIPINTTELSEGTNQYFTNARARTAISVTGSGSYDNTTGVITVTGGVTSVNTLTGAVTLSTTNISEGTNLYYTDTRANTAFDNRLAAKTTTNLTEGTNLYYTNARANSAMAAFTGNLTAGNASLGNLVTANYFAGTLTTAAQPNITSVGTLANLSVTGFATLPQIRYQNAWTQNFSASYNFNSYLNIGEYQKIMVIIPSGNAENYSIYGKVYVQRTDNTQIIDVQVNLRSNTLPNLSWEIWYDEDLNGISSPYVNPVLWTKTTSTAGFIFAVEGLVDNIHSMTVQLQVVNRYSTYYDNVTLFTGAEVSVIDTGYTSRAFTLRQRRIENTSTTVNTPLNITGNITGANLIAGSSGTGNVYAGNVVATSVIVNGQPTTYGVVSPKYISVTNNTPQNIANVSAGGTTLTWDTTLSSNGITYSAGGFALTAGLAYQIQAEISLTNYTGYMIVQLVDTSNNSQIGSPQQATIVSTNAGFAEANNGTLDFIYTPSANQTVAFRVVSGSANITGQHRGTGFSRASIVQLNPTIAVQATATGTVATNYIATTRTGSGQTFTGAGDVILNTTDKSSGSSVSYNTSTGVYTLTAGTTYELSFNPSWSFSGSSNDPYVQYDWVDATTNTSLDGDSGSFATAYSYQYNYAQQNQKIISQLVYTPSTNQTVKIRVTSTQAGGIITTLGVNSSAYVKAMNAIFALNALDTMTTTGNVTVGGNLTVTGNISSAGLIWTISASDSTNYTFSGPGIVAGNTNDPVLYLYRGFTYTFVNTTTTSHPFAIRVSNSGSAYTAGITGSQTGTQTFIVPMNAPSTLYYQCTIHSGMGNTINIV